MGFVQRRHVSKANVELQWAGFRVIEIEDRDLFKAHKRLKKEIKTRPYFGLCRISGFPSFLCLEIESDAGCESGVDIHLGRN